MILIPPDLTNISNIRRYQQRYEAIQAYFYKTYMHFNYERSKLLNQIRDSISKNVNYFNFDNWHRIIDLKFVNQALSSIGSVLNDPGGRFNIGNIDETKFPKFPALYIAEDWNTAFKEKNQTDPNQTIEGLLTADELTLTNTHSTVNLLVEGELEIIDLTNDKALKDFYKVIKHIKLPKSLESEGKKLNISIPYHVKSFDELKKSILEHNWRAEPAQVDIPANSQIFGQYVHEAAVEAILYPSKMSSKRKCLAIYPRNFSNTDSFVRIKDKDLPKNIECIALNSETYTFL